MVKKPKEPSVYAVPKKIGWPSAVALLVGWIFLQNLGIVPKLGDLQSTTEAKAAHVEMRAADKEEHEKIENHLTEAVNKMTTSVDKFIARQEKTDARQDKDIRELRRMRRRDRE